ncbi:cyclin-dependent kinase 10 [Anaeramoeba ignava]|uniref:cyclin-dependent kinase n=1 Tax=Anaeramoeba ignava TaxID=1746090 RepID=A0A9Q0R9N9_ANAIG|nr:cyclin-dependent kinase 10 [Anaeramoeba ignava]
MDLPELRSINDFGDLAEIGQGTYGVVFRAKDLKTKEIVALKKVKMGEKEKEGFPITTLREYRILKKIKHRNIINLHEIVCGDEVDEFYLVFDFCPHDLSRLLATMTTKHSPFTVSEIKSLMIQLLNAVAYAHENHVIHRDIKLSNLLFNDQGELKLCDFGLSREIDNSTEAMTPIVQSLWYRAPEVLLGETHYTEKIDMWSVGCIMGELIQNQPLFQGLSELDQLSKIFKVLGTPSVKLWPKYPDLPGVKMFQLPQYEYNELQKLFPFLSSDGLDILNRMLTYDFEKRISAKDALLHPYWSQSPLPKDVQMIRTFPSSFRPINKKSHFHFSNQK